MARYNAPPFGGLYIGQPDKADAAMKQWMKDNPPPKVTLGEVADHVEHVADQLGRLIVLGNFPKH